MNLSTTTEIALDKILEYLKEEEKVNERKSNDRTASRKAE